VYCKDYSVVAKNVIRPSYSLFVRDGK
jgi:hypothetical protein